MPEKRNPKSPGGKVKVTGIYRHYRGNLYLVEDMATHTETGERMVVYRALYGERDLYTQPAARFLETVKRGRYHGPRMTHVTIPEKDE